MGSSLGALGKAQEALDYFKQALAMYKRLYPDQDQADKEHPCITQYLNNLINTLNKIEDQALLQQTKDEVLPLCKEWLGEEHALTQQLCHAGRNAWGCSVQ